MKKILAVLTSLVFIFCLCCTVSADSTARTFYTEQAYAESLKELGLFQGVSENDFDLERAPTRVEALVMLIRVLGKESSALDGSWRHPFKDVPAWADAYVGYAYATRLTNGISPTEFGGGNATASTYLTFMLRALGYSDTAGADFSWDNPFDLAKTCGILTESVDTESFLRADAASISFNALSAKLKGEDKTLAQKLIDKGVFTSEQYLYHYNKNSYSRNQSGKSVLSAVEISEKCTDAVFQIYSYAFNGELVSLGSGFFISEDGVAVTNFHVAQHSSYLFAFLNDGRYYEDINIMDGDFSQDLALLKFKSEDKFKYLEINDYDEIKQGQTLYAIGNPEGLSNTLSQGIVSNVKRVLNGTEYFQMTAPITNGSSGGPVVNEYGEVIGVSAAGFGEANLNLAVPIGYIHNLENNPENDYFLWGDNPYPGFYSALDFGTFSNVALLSAEETIFGYHLRYDAKDFHEIISVDDEYIIAKAENCRIGTINRYFLALEAEGFEAEYVDSITTSFKTEDENILFIYDENKGKVIEIYAELTPVYYTPTPEIPHAGWFLDLPLESGEETGYKSHRCSYKWNEYYSKADFANLLSKYFAWYEQDGFELMSDGTRDGVAVREYRGKGYKVSCSFDETHFYIEFSKI